MIRYSLCLDLKKKITIEVFQIKAFFKFCDIQCNTVIQISTDLQEALFRAVQGRAALTIVVLSMARKPYTSLFFKQEERI